LIASQQALNPDLQIIGVLRTMYDARNALTRDVSAELEQFLVRNFMDTVIPRNVRLLEAPARFADYLFREKLQRCNGLFKFAAEMLKKVKEKRSHA
jgi:chromosome partitioning protein